MKQERLALLTELIRNGELASQHDAVEALKAHGINATQATVSRDLQEVGAVRASRGGKVRYVLQSEASSYGASLGFVLREFVLRRAISQNIVVLHTPPGHAGVVAAAIDRSQPEGILGVIAGDDTLFLCCEETASPKEILAHFDELATTSDDTE